MQEIADKFPGEHVLVATHGGSIRCAIYAINGERTNLSGNCSLTRLKHASSTNQWQINAIAQPPEDATW
jgi:broad specificity phosphatase PhoE